MKKDTFLRSVLRIALPVALQAMLQSSFSMIDQIMVGQLGSDGVAAIEVASRPAFIYITMIGALAAIAGIMVSQYMGQKDYKAGDRSLSVGLVGAGALATLFMAVCLIFARQVVGIYTEDAAIIDIGTGYIGIIAWTYIPMGVSTVLAVMIRCMDMSIYPLYASLASALVNTALNYLLIFGKLGFPQMGVTGAAIASLTSQVLNLLLILLFFRMANRRIGKTFRFDLNLGKAGYLQYVAMLMPILINEFLWSLGQNVNTYLYGHLGTWPLAAMALTGPVQGLLFGALSGISQAAGILVGKRLGEREYEAAYQESKQLMLYGLVGSLALSALLAGLSWPYANIYNVEPEVKEIARWLLIALAVLAPVKVQNMVLGGGIIRSGGKTKYIMIIDTVGTWLVGVPLGFLTTFVFKLNIVWVYFILSQEELVRYIITVFMFRSRRWMETIE